MAKKAGIRLKTREEIDKMRRAGRVVHRILKRCRELCVPGVTTAEIDQEAQRLIDEAGGTGMFRGYTAGGNLPPFPSTLCLSVNEVVVHGIANDTPIEDGDIVGVDCGVQIDGWCGDSATTILVGDVAEDTRAMCEATQHVLQIAIENMRPGRQWSQVARLMQNYAESNGYGVVRDFVGHGIGQTMHEEPKVPNFVTPEPAGLGRNGFRGKLKRRAAAASPGADFTLREGMTLAVEPMCYLVEPNRPTGVVTLRDKWTVVTHNRRPAAHYEHTLAVTADGCEILTDGN
ncbi:MAG: type I methionyl aminopeptidase [Planctomycetota bacterium]